MAGVLDRRVSLPVFQSASLPVKIVVGHQYLVEKEGEESWNNILFSNIGKFIENFSITNSNYPYFFINNPINNSPIPYS